ncbi:cell envelope integrity protein CreD [Algivirga pacifica]|uniref:Cell envelope integrity protein CreD n=2 Tax=Algivirga pacifica TaxID=1162670 RepID=A0ABP9DA67_9BACT
MVRIFTVGIIILLLLIPVSMVENLIWERQQRQKEASSEISGKWGYAQTISGLVLTVPYKVYKTVYNKEREEYERLEEKKYAYFLPDDLAIDGVVSPEMRYRGIFQVIVYNAVLSVKGKFLQPDFRLLKIDEKDVLWEDASINLGVSDLRGLQEEVTLKWNKNSYAMNPGTTAERVLERGINTPVLLSKEGEQYTFDISLNFNGSSRLLFTPLGKVSNVHIASSWKDPSYTGAFLPDHREITEDGFTADWKVLHLNRPYPQQFTGRVEGIDESTFGVNLIRPNDEYQKSMRTAKYAVMFIALTFLVFFFSQTLNKVRIHPIQYIMVGLALCTFYVLLIALSEHIPFYLSYTAASTAIIVMITLYAHTIFKGTRITLMLGGIMTALYGFIYIIIQQEDYALLIGSIGLFTILGGTMYLSRKIDWHNLESKK